jgi:hypothetical protein
MNPQRLTYHLECAKERLLIAQIRLLSESLTQLPTTPWLCIMTALREINLSIDALETLISEISKTPAPLPSIQPADTPLQTGLQHPTVEFGVHVGKKTGN